MDTTETTAADRLLSQIEVAIGAITPRDGQNAALIKQMLESVNGRALGEPIAPKDVSNGSDVRRVNTLSTIRNHRCHGVMSPAR